MAGSASVKYVRALALDKKLITHLGSMPFSATGTRRLCMHDAASSPLHVMVVECVAGSSFPCHYHRDGDEVTTIVNGRMEILIWDKGLSSSPTRLVLGNDEHDAKAAHIPRHTPHLTRPLGGNCVYMEVKVGPFDKDNLVVVKGGCPL